MPTLALLRVATAIASRAAPTDVGYELLFADDPAATTEIEWKCWDAPALPSWINGSWIMPSVSQFSMKNTQFQGVLDGFGKLHRFQLAGRQVCLKARMMASAFYNDSVATGTVAPPRWYAPPVGARPPPGTNCPPL